MSSSVGTQTESVHLNDQKPARNRCGSILAESSHLCTCDRPKWREFLPQALVINPIVQILHIQVNTLCEITTTLTHTTESNLVRSQ